MKLRIGIIFGGTSREREISFAGGRTVYDNLNKELFDAVPLFMDSFGHLVLLDWKYIYKGSIRDFYPDPQLNQSQFGFQLYAENLDCDTVEKQKSLSTHLGKNILHDELPTLIDFAFLCLHGADGEDGRMQGLLELLRIPYSGSGILSSTIGMNKHVQKMFMQHAGFNVPKYISISQNRWNDESQRTEFFNLIKEKVHLACVVKSANQGSSIGVSVLSKDDFNDFVNAVDKSFFTITISKSEWNEMNESQQVDWIRSLADIREGISLPVIIDSKLISHPDELLKHIRTHFQSNENSIFISAENGETEVLVEEFISGKEFSCIVIENENGLPVALPPTEIRKGKEVFDYRSKYLPGLSRKITPIELPDEQLQQIRHQCEQLYKALHFNVYARLDGFITDTGTIYLNDPNTTSGMLPSSFFFHQAAEIGLNPSQFLTYIIRTSLFNRIYDFKERFHLPQLVAQLDKAIEAQHSNEKQKIKVAVMLGGYSSERHISVESGRNIYEKLSSSDKYEPIPVFVTGDKDAHQLYQIPINIMLKDNADDIKEKIMHYHLHPAITQIQNQCKVITDKYASLKNILPPTLITYDELAKLVDAVFIGLHGRPGEDGQVQFELDKRKIPYNGSGVQSSQTTIDKFITNEILMRDGMMAARHKIVLKNDWKKDAELFYQNLEKEFPFPFIAKPVDDGCSSAVKVIRNRETLSNFCKLIFRDSDELDAAALAVLKLKPKEEFPSKERFLVEELIARKSNEKFLEVTGGMLTHISEKGEKTFEVFEASEALSEGEVLSLEEKFLAGQGQNITPARYDKDKTLNQKISDKVKVELERAARALNVEGYCRIDAFVRIMDADNVEVIFIEVNSLPGMTPATAIFHQAAINGYKPYDFIDKILEYGRKKLSGRN